MKTKNQSQKIKNYFKELEEKAMIEYNIAKEARKKGFEPKKEVEIKLARNIGERVEGLIISLYEEIKDKGISEKILEYEKKYGNGDWRVAFKIGKDCVEGKFVKKEIVELVELGVRIGLTYLTQGTVSAPLEGIVGIKKKERYDGKNFLSLFFAGPIRAAGGTAMSVAVILTDYLRRITGFGKWDVSDIEIKRIIHEMEMYHERVSRLQYFPNEKELTFLLKNLPIEINGDPTTKKDVLIHKEAGRIETSKIRGGMCLVLGEGLSQKAAKILGGLEKFYEQFELEDWKFLKKLKNFSTKEELEEDKKESEELIKPNEKYLVDAVGGRPIFSFPSHKYGFRIRYGRTRVTGSEAFGFNPVTSKILNDFLAIGTQLKIERPGKGCSVTVCDGIRGPLVKLIDGSVLRIDDKKSYDKYKYDVSEIIFLGDVLINYGAFKEHKSQIVPSPFVEEWWVKILEKSKLEKNSFEKDLIKNFFLDISYEKAKEISIKHKIPLHPKFVFHYKNLSKNELLELIDFFEKNQEKSLNGGTVFKTQERGLEILEKLLIPFKVSNNFLIFDKDDKTALFDSLKFCEKNDFYEIKKLLKITKNKEVLEILNELKTFEIKDVRGYSMGARMGRPEKAKMRKLKTSPHFLFPVGEEGGRLRSFNHALEVGYIKSSFPINFCKDCKIYTVVSVCEKCDKPTIKKNYCGSCKKYVTDEIHCGEKTRGYEFKKIDIRKIFQGTKRRLGTSKQTLDNTQKIPELIKGVRGVNSERRFVESIEKGVLRAEHKVYVNKDGTIRFDLSEMPLTHFKPFEIGTSVEKLKELGYFKDYLGNELINDSQIIELFPQDVILPSNEEFKESDIFRDIFNTTKFLDDLLIKIYGLKKFYNFKTKKEVIGLLMIALAPHTSAGTIVRLIGFTKSLTGIAHPLLHAACRRDCDGDELGFMVLLDGFLNFSHDYLPNLRGTKNMDAPLVLGLSLDTNIIDDEVYNFDVSNDYGIEFYELSQKGPKPDEIKIEVIEDRLGTFKQFEDYGFTHSVKDFNNGVLVSSYKTIPTMKEKVEKQMDLAFKIRAIDSSKVASLVIEKHFIRDIKGNLRKFSGQQFRCVKCNDKIRRPPMKGVCDCGGKILLTIHEGSIVKYLQQTSDLSEKYNVPDYLKQSIRLLNNRIDQVFGKKHNKQKDLKKWF